MNKYFNSILLALYFILLNNTINSMDIRGTETISNISKEVENYVTYKAWLNEGQEQIKIIANKTKTDQINCSIEYKEMFYHLDELYFFRLQQLFLKIKNNESSAKKELETILKAAYNSVKHNKDTNIKLCSIL